MDTVALEKVIAETEFSGVVKIVDASGTLFESATGLASRRWNVPVALDTRFDTASITKLFTAVAVLQLVETGELDLEASIHDYVDLDDTTISPKVTLLHLLTHTSGVADDVDEEAGESYDELWSRVPVYTLTETIDLLATFAQKPAVTEPGVEPYYSDSGYVLAGLALESVTERRYRDVVTSAIFDVADMPGTGFWDRRSDAPAIAEGWNKSDDGTWTESVFAAPPIGNPASGAQATADDLLSFLRSLRSGGLLTAEMTEEFLTPQVEFDEDLFYGFGLEFDLDDDGEVRSYYADGVGAGSSGIVRHYPAAGVDMVVLSNSEDGAWDVVREIDGNF